MGIFLDKPLLSTCLHCKFFFFFKYIWFFFWQVYVNLVFSISSEKKLNVSKIPMGKIKYNGSFKEVWQTALSFYIGLLNLIQWKRNGGHTFLPIHCSVIGLSLMPLCSWNLACDSGILWCRYYTHMLTWVISNVNLNWIFKGLFFGWCFHLSICGMILCLINISLHDFWIYLSFFFLLLALHCCTPWTITVLFM